MRSTNSGVVSTTVSTSSDSLYAGTTTPTRVSRYISQPPVDEAALLGGLGLEHSVHVHQHWVLTRGGGRGVEVQLLEGVVGGRQQHAVGAVERQRLADIDAEVVGH